MDRLSVLQDHHAQVFVRLRDVRPKTDSSGGLNLAPKGFADGLFTPSALKLGSLSHHLLVEIARCSHAVKRYVSGTTGALLTANPREAESRRPSRRAGRRRLRFTPRPTSPHGGGGVVVSRRPLGRFPLRHNPDNPAF